MPNIILTKTLTNGRKPRYKTQAAVTDMAANVILAVLYDNGENGTFVEVHRIAPNGVKTLLDSRPSELGKMDSLCATKSGRNLHVFPSAHDGDYKSDVTMMTFENVLAYNHLTPDVDDTAGAFVGEPTQPEVEVDYARLQRMIDTAVTNIVGNVKPKAAAAIQEAGVLTLGNVYDSAGLYNRLRDTVYEVLVTNGVIPPPTPALIE